MQTRRVGVDRVFKAEAGRLAVHVRDKRGDRARHKVGKRRGGIVVAAANSGVKQVAHGQLFTVGQVQLAAAHAGQHRGCDRHGFVQPPRKGAAGQIARHQLDGRGGVDHLVRIFFVKGQVVFEIDKKNGTNSGIVRRGDGGGFSP